MFIIPAKDQSWVINTPQIMGIMNATSDSFYASSRVKQLDLVIEKAGNFIENGASIIDIGGQSTRPGAAFLTETEEINNVVPIIEAIRSVYPALIISIDTFQSKVAAAALDAGANIVNDISCGRFDPAILSIVTKFNAGFIGMHLTGDKNAMHEIPNRTNLTQDVLAYFVEKKNQLANLGIQNWIVDPGFGFGKTVTENFQLVKNLNQLKSLDLPILLGVSRKSSIYKTLDIKAEDALNGTTVVNTIGLLNGANILRVHDVKEAKQIVSLLPLLT